MHNDLSKVLKWVRTVDVKTLPYDVIGVGWGPKISNNQPTGEYGVIFSVIEKKPLELLNPFKVVPKNLNIENNNVVTDVQKVKYATAFIDNCHDTTGNLPPVSANRARVRPLSGGCEASDTWNYWIGTLGMFVTDKTDGQVVGLSNNHILASIQTNAPFNIPNNSGTTNTYNISGFQPVAQYRSATQEQDFIGRCKKNTVIGNIDSNVYDVPGFPASILGITTTDSAILKLNNYTSLIDKSSVNIINFNKKGPYQWATDEEIDSLLLSAHPNFGSPVFKSGRTTGPVGYPGHDTTHCQLSVFELNDTIVGFNSVVGFRLSLFLNQIGVRGDVKPAAGGDSGSVYFALLSSTIPTASAWKAIGLLAAGNDELGTSWASRITQISTDLNVIPWNGVMPTLSSTVSYVLTGENISSPTISLSGRTYYQIGRTLSAFEP